MLITRYFERERQRQRKKERKEKEPSIIFICEIEVYTRWRTSRKNKSFETKRPRERERTVHKGSSSSDISKNNITNFRGASKVIGYIDIFIRTTNAIVEHAIKLNNKKWKPWYTCIKNIVFQTVGKTYVRSMHLEYLATRWKNLGVSFIFYSKLTSTYLRRKKDRYNNFSYLFSFFPTILKNLVTTRRETYIINK